MDQQKYVTDDKSMVKFGTPTEQETQITKIIPRVWDIFQKQAEFLTTKPLSGRKGVDGISKRGLRASREKITNNSK